MEILIAAAVFGVCFALLALGTVLGGRNLHTHCGSGGDPEVDDPCRLCGNGGPGVCAKESVATETLFEATLANPCHCPKESAANAE
ncbi:MAG: hypothetical protein AUJ96_32485 [Armatimonadetes bacterium CG2_30_66_41]|nr:hypothetical protein [Armatimonadota bacterium]OIO92330.1 MAG: hypothetical protein AUJ96_32485 [Armatimonadetes bacterium CG2_30_66_41]NCO92129.1 hypothetical protein [Armatimonadota bacterium]NCP32466.1 hypothetical protein [Armatimonadota bacterium]NCQ29649.1 hypothetical protein [Armatimonadota bacterium]